jgi:hypothetical protein
MDHQSAAGSKKPSSPTVLLIKKRAVSVPASDQPPCSARFTARTG